MPQIIAYADGSKGVDDMRGVQAVRKVLRTIDWARIELIERATNIGLGRNILSGVTEVAARYDSFIVWEDDLICVPGTYAWLCAALRAYADEPKVMSVTAWTHPRVTPPGVRTNPYFDGRAECWVWGTWARAWRGMTEENALTKMAAAQRRGTRSDAYGADLPQMARNEARRNIWAVRWLYHHLQQGGLCVRPPWSMVEHIGFDASATNADESAEWGAGKLAEAPPVPADWSAPFEHPVCRDLWRATIPPVWRCILRYLRNRLRRFP
ncbi:MAG: hypothetical protein QM691_10210 [Opitutaceae bacterium]